MFSVYKTPQNYLSGSKLKLILISATEDRNEKSSRDLKGYLIELDDDLNSLLLMKSYHLKAGFSRDISLLYLLFYR